MAKSIVSAGKAFSQSAGERFLYLTRQGAVVISKEGAIITAYTAAEFTDDLIALLKLIGIM